MPSALVVKNGVNSCSATASSMPLRRGAAEGLIRAELTDGSVIEKKITPKGAQPTRRTDAEGKRTGIDSLQGWISEEVFNPLAFAALADSKAGRRAQAEVISEIAGLNTAKLDDERAQHLADESAAKKAADEAATGWAAVTKSLSDYAKGAMEWGKGLGETLTSAFSSAESLVVP